MLTPFPSHPCSNPSHFCSNPYPKALRDYLRSASEFQMMLMELHNRTMAATLIQAAWRARVVRHAFAPVWEAHQMAKREVVAAEVIQRVSGAGGWWEGGWGFGGHDFFRLPSFPPFCSDTSTPNPTLHTT